mgnify:CR=1 FL=1
MQDFIPKNMSNEKFEEELNKLSGNDKAVETYEKEISSISHHIIIINFYHFKFIKMQYSPTFNRLKKANLDLARFLRLYNSALILDKIYSRSLYENFINYIFDFIIG